MNKSLNSNISGALGEEICARFLETQGFSILEKNIRKQWGEIDILAKKRSTYSFVEVKTVSRETFTEREEGPGFRVHKEKLRKLKKAILSYVSKMNMENLEWDFLVAEVFIETKTKRSWVNILEQPLS